MYKQGTSCIVGVAHASVSGKLHQSANLPRGADVGTKQTSGRVDPAELGPNLAGKVARKVASAGHKMTQSARKDIKG